MQNVEIMQGVQANNGRKGGWSEEETGALFDDARRALDEGFPLRDVFEKAALRSGRQPNSVRNYYYANIKKRADAHDMKRALPFVPFTQEEVHNLLRSVLLAKAQGMSVRACLSQLSGGVAARTLRYQNKYRAILKANPEMLTEVANELAAEGLTVDVVEAPASTHSKQRDQMLAMMAQEAALAPLLDALQDLFVLATSRAASHKKLEEADRYKVQCDLLRITMTQMQRHAQHLEEVLQKDWPNCPEEAKQALSALLGV